MKMGLRRAAHELGLFWCREPDLKTEPAARRHQEVSPHLGGSTRGKVSDEGPPAARQPSAGGRPMQVAQERCCGLDVHKKSVVACVITPEGQEIRTFGTMTRAPSQSPSSSRSRVMVPKDRRLAAPWAAARQP